MEVFSMAFLEMANVNQEQFYSVPSVCSEELGELRAAVDAR
jgi:hypothetical protein